MALRFKRIFTDKIIAYRLLPKFRKVFHFALSLYSQIVLTFTHSMKNFFKDTAVLLLAVAVMVSSAGVTVFKMVCCKKNKTEISLEEFKCCKHKEKQGTNFSKKCCDYSTLTFKIEQLFKSDENHHELLPLQLSTFNIQSSIFNSFFELNFSFTNSSPPISGRTLLNFISTLLI